jgi:sugar-specific transcriptional regulator TrmB
MTPLDLQKIGDGLDLEPIAADVYVSVLAHGELKKEELQLLLELSEHQVASSLEHLLARGFIRIVPGNGNDEYEAVPLSELPMPLQQRTSLLRELERFIPPTLQLSQKLGIVKYEGLPGIRKAYLEVLEEAKQTKEPILAFEKGTDAASLGAAFIDKYVQRRIGAGIEAYVLSPAAAEDKAYKEKYEGKLTHVKLLPAFDIKANINIVGDLVMSFDLDPAQGTLRRDHGEVATLKALFWELWKRED